MNSNIFFWAGPGLARVFVGLSVGVLALASAAAEPMQLGNEHLGMTSEGVSAASNTSKDEARVAAELAKSEWRTEDPSDAPPQAVANTGPAASNYEDCVELAIRSGNGFRASSSVCLALFPGAYAYQAQTAPLSQAASPDDEPLLLTLPPSTRVAELSEPEGSGDPWESETEQEPDSAEEPALEEADAAEEPVLDEPGSAEAPVEGVDEAASSGSAQTVEDGAAAESAATPAAEAAGESSAEAAPEAPEGA